MERDNVFICSNLILEKEQTTMSMYNINYRIEAQAWMKVEAETEDEAHMIASEIAVKMFENPSFGTIEYVETTDLDAEVLS
jgi:hypothetical protein